MDFIAIIFWGILGIWLALYAVVRFAKTAWVFVAGEKGQGRIVSYYVSSNFMAFFIPSLRLWEQVEHVKENQKNLLKINLSNEILPRNFLRHFYVHNNKARTWRDLWWDLTLLCVGLCVGLFTCWMWLWIYSSILKQPYLGKSFFELMPYLFSIGIVGIVGIFIRSMTGYDCFIKKVPVRKWISFYRRVYRFAKLRRKNYGSIKIFPYRKFRALQGSSISSEQARELEFSLEYWDIIITSVFVLLIFLND